MPSALQLHRITPITLPAAAAAAAEPPSKHDQRLQAAARTVCPVSGDIAVPEEVLGHHTHAVAPGQCCSAAVQAIGGADVEAVWAVVRRFDRPQAYKHFVRSCHVIVGEGGVGTLREVRVVSGLPAARSTERLEILDDERHVTSFSVVGGDHRLRNYRSVTTLHPAAAADGGGTVVVESYVVDVPVGNTKEETCAFVDTIVRCNLQSLAKLIVANNNNNNLEN
ncbi:abscisic acid receptor PYL4-like [Andrographis paniculata]|uniref:abscisic acid receptor PYL4-like n=1 Tax=Andrographis paniculata TaxID=175694 RepID=UPI0021E7D6D5|nr:abscisic acid receptor PYL4-like [Andrographis paniculata]